MNDTEPDLDIGRLARLGAFDDPAIAQIIERFLNTLDDRVAGMQAASAEGDTKQLVWLAHQLRGSAANCGFAGLATSSTALDAAPLSFDVRICGQGTDGMEAFPEVLTPSGLDGQQLRGARFQRPQMVLPWLHRSGLIPKARMAGVQGRVRQAFGKVRTAPNPRDGSIQGKRMVRTAVGGGLFARRHGSVTYNPMTFPEGSCFSGPLNPNSCP